MNEEDASLKQDSELDEDTPLVLDTTRDLHPPYEDEAP